MDASPPVVTVRFNRFLPYWAVFQTDFHYTLRSWVYRLWVLMAVVASTGLLVYRMGLHTEAGLFQSAAAHCSDVFRLLIAGSLALIVVLAVSAISGERATVADAVLSRGISRYQYFLAKWHARLLVVAATFAVLAACVLLASYFLFQDASQSDLSLRGGLAAILTVCALFAVIVSWGVTIGALTNSTMLGITIFWLVLYGSGFLLTLLPEPWPSPERHLARLQFMLQGQFNSELVTQLLLGSGVLCLLAAGIGLLGFSRRDV